ncbi:hypothetical protein BJY24_007571 [Nocardia transvalensis]|uniref:DUF4254 domain-containing protein n=1 Tax=Nocardia transvalensis TaxID=37333 RepID=A0A7W9PN07_9NOCA|nr:hypothetical protein [Nocardia transvalensis]MBB5918659.1 hypothetical protein [Nocardia transvalensis]
MYAPQRDGVDRPSAGTAVAHRPDRRTSADRRWSDGPAPLLPDWHELLAAFLGHIGDQPGDHPVTRWARALAELHLERRDDPPHTAEIDRRRGELVARIDGWVATHTVSRPSAGSLGAAVDAMAAAQVRAAHLLRSVESVSDERVHSAWFLLASLADGWTDLVQQRTGVRWSRPAHDG